MNNALRKKLTEQQELVKELADHCLMAVDNEARRAHENRDAKRLKELELYCLGVKDLKTGIIMAIENEKQKRGRET